MVRFTAVIAAAAAGAALAGGCTVQQLKAGMYEGIRANNTLHSSPQERMGRPETPDYHQYEQLRKEQAR